LFQYITVVVFLSSRKFYRLHFVFFLRRYFIQTFAEKCKNKHIYTRSRVKRNVVRKYLIAISSRQLYIVERKFALFPP